MSVTEQTDTAHSDSLRTLSLAALGVVFGDIGTSPIYALRESFHQSHGVQVSIANTLGILSLIFWSLIIVISIKYLALVMQADNEGEGGIIALTALVMPRRGPVTGRRHLLVLTGLFGAALLYGDSMITPAISVLSAIEGLEVVTPVLSPYVLPVTVGILVALFAFQRRGTARVGSLFGPVTLVWFLVLAVLGISQIVRHPGVLVALNPYHGLTFFARNGLSGLLVLGSVFLVVTGGEALYADMGHFGTRPIRLTWGLVVLPALVINYFGQGALIIAEPATVEQPFFEMAPSWSLPLVVAIATAATVIASQAVISGAFSLTRQAVQLGYLPRLTIDHTSDRQIGQIYIPAANWALMLACIGLVLGFRTSGRLAAAYGVAVTTDMVFTTLLFAVVARLRFKWSLRVVIPLTAALLLGDLAFWGANLPKIPHGGWFPLLVAGTMFTVMTTWKLGRARLVENFHRRSVSIPDLVSSLKAHPPNRVPGTAIFLTSDPQGAPRALLHNLKHNKVLHERVLFLTVETLDVPYATARRRVVTEDLGMGFYRVEASFGFAESPSVPDVLRQVDIPDYSYSEMTDSFFTGELTVVVPDRPGIARWRAILFERMHRNAQRATAYFGIPPNRVVGMGAQVEI
ncbi:MAG: potassium transporter Kup [Gemmatimonadota bacterium]